MTCNFDAVHSFTIQDIHILLDINSGIVHSLSRMAWDFYQEWEKAGGDAPRAIEALAKTYDPKELQEIHRQFESLREEGMLFSRDDSLAGYELPEDTLIKALCLHVAHDCNLRCAYCFADTGSFGGKRGLMDADTGKRAIDFLFEVSGPRKHIEVDYFGGEPLLNFAVVRELIQYGRAKAQACGKELKQTLTTNAVLLDAEKSDFLNAHGVQLILSLDGRPQVHDRMRPATGGQGSYERVRAGIREYLSRPNSAGYFIRGTYTRYNPDFCEDVRHLVEQGFLNLSLEPVVAPAGVGYALTEEDLPQIFEEYEKLAELLYAYGQTGQEVNFFHYNISLDKGPCLPKRLSGCGAGHEYLAVSPEGDLYPCHQFVGQEEYKIGHVSTGVRNFSIGREFRRAHVFNKPQCRGCWARFLCSGGCHANACSLNRNILEPYRIGCAIQQKRLECALYLQVRKMAGEQDNPAI
ncbi:MAG: thioether cross-link-forming SCIFF peptide maturase [Clostridia bacterium]|jgi:uncharacterized protein|nr:thioether cross-link-forming SCIFF peptide maturase [Clostridia bacterium]